jgi:hypothetical protein
MSQIIRKSIVHKCSLPYGVQAGNGNKFLLVLNFCGRREQKMNNTGGACVTNKWKI